MTANRFDVIVIGKGLMGSAAFRHCVELGARTLLVGPDEPANPASHKGVFGAHYDQARLTHLHGADEVWGELNRRSIGRYRQIEKAGRVEFYYPVGELFVADQGVPSRYLAPSNIQHSQQHLGVDLEGLSHSQRSNRFPFLSFPDDARAVHEIRPAGHINPRMLIQAQVNIGTNGGGSVVSEQVATVEQTATGMTVTTLANTGGGARFEASRVLIAAGSFSNAPGLLAQPLPLTLKTETVVFGQVAEAEAKGLRSMPVIHYDIHHPTLADIYVVPPVQYPDGNYYIKLGANTATDRYLNTVAEMREWYADGPSIQNLSDLREAMQAMVPGLDAARWHTGRCVITRTPNKLPIIEVAVPGKVYVSVGGNGSSASCSDAIGEIAAGLVVTGKWQDDLDHSNFATS